MKLFDKIKNYFYDEEVVDENSKQTAVTKENHPDKVKIDTKLDKKEHIEIKDNNLDIISERELFKSEPTFNFPIIFDDEDFKEPVEKKSRINTSVVEQTKVEEHIEKKVFKPSPIISPIYGILDASEKEEKAKKSDDNLLDLYEDNKKVDIDDVLSKVYSKSRVEIKSDNYTENEDTTSKAEVSLDIFDDANNKREVKNSTDNSIKNIDNKLKNIDELLESTDDEDFYSLVDSMYKENDEEGEK